MKSQPEDGPGHAPACCNAWGATIVNRITVVPVVAPVSVTLLNLPWSAA